jgi:hypothetical protein
MAKILKPLPKRFFDVTNISTPVDGIYFQYTNGTNWVGYITAGSAGPTTVDTGVAWSSDWIKLTAVVTYTGVGTGSVQFKVNGTNVGAAQTTNIPLGTGNLCGPAAQMYKNAAAGSNNMVMNIDYLHLVTTWAR